MLLNTIIRIKGRLVLNFFLLGSPTSISYLDSDVLTDTEVLQYVPPGVV